MTAAAQRADEKWMRRSLALAARGGRAAWPNPKVGCVLVKNGRLLASSWHRRCGGPHAEPLALAKAGTRAKGATAYLTMEPCCAHPGKRTPPCANALVAARVARVVAAMKDPNPAVAGRGLALLKRAGIKTESGLLAQEAEALNKPFICRMRHKRPYVILKSALSLDGKAFARGGASRWITGPGARAAVHKLRARVDAVLVGVNTAIMDDPALTAHGLGPNPLAVVLDAHLRLPRRSRLLRGPRRPIIFTSSSRTLRNAEVVRVPSKAGLLNLKAVLAELAKRQCGLLLVEGGPTVHASFLAAGFVDEVYAFIAPKLLGAARDPNTAPRLAQPRLTRVGSDFLFYGRL